MDKVFIRFLEEGDAKLSWKWRNDPEIWKQTGQKPDKHISYEMELEWIQKKLQRHNELRFAICEKQTGAYIGNVQLTDINGYDAALHIFIGVKEKWGKGYGTEATKLMVEYGLGILQLQSVYLDVKKDNIAAITAYARTGFADVFEYDHYRRMAIYKDKSEKKLSVFVMTYNHENYIRHALDGILMQLTDFEFDIVLGDDFSTDNTRTVVLDYAIKYPGKFKLLFYPCNVSAAINQNWVLKNCSGEYTAMCEGDDFWNNPLKLKKQVGFLDANPEYSLCCHAFDTVNENGIFVENYTAEWEQKFPAGFDITPEIYFGKWITQTLTTVFRKNLMDNIPDYSFITDTVIFFHLLLRGKGFWLNFKGGCYRIHSGGSWNGLTLKNSLILSYKIFEDLYKKHKDIPALRKALNAKTGQIIEYNMHDENIKETRFSNLWFYCLKYYKRSESKKDAWNYIYLFVVKKIILRSKIFVRRVFDKKYRTEVNKYRS